MKFSLHSLAESAAVCNTLFFPFLGVFFITKTDGNVDVWDLLDRYLIVTEIYHLRPMGHLHGDVYYDQNPSGFRSEERRVGKECRSRWSPYH